MSQSPAPPRRRRGNARGEQTRSVLLAAAVRSFADRGFHGTSTRDIALAAEMSPAVMYAHYATKEELLFELSIDGHRSVQALLETEVRRHTTTTDRLRAAAACFGQWHAEFHLQARVVQYELDALSEEHLAEVTVLRRAIQGRFGELIRNGVDEGSFQVADVEMTAMSLTSLGIDVARWYRSTGKWTPEQIGRHHGRLALRAVGVAG
ncbi:TetR/AcrR family transcriptional regulator [Nocardioides sp. LHD-245]|uniref:TetR/AcrR family transcriptional regulator n=1 Tax=Nocardioides sp. LHD-245 TaxID=3051387 RepID=UPI0027DFD3BD|nr:TetR/AcrR family transcriptional regulator [Nocardioides sp. LHD-245]